MPVILHIHTALATASVCLSSADEVMHLGINQRQQDHASWLHNEIKTGLKKTGASAKELDAISVTIGPGSYTGLRVGLSAAKGLCYALRIPLLTIGTLDIMAAAVKQRNADLLCPMIDARRMEVFTALFDREMTRIKNPFALIVDDSSFSEELSSNSIIFCGDGSKKLQPLLKREKNATFSNDEATAADMVSFANQLFAQNIFTDLAYSEPLYVKEFLSPTR